MKSTTARKLNQDKPERIIRMAVWGMLPKNRLGRQLIKKLKIYRGVEHRHEAQQPERMVLWDAVRRRGENAGMAEQRFSATGKRKTAVARVWVKPGSGVVVINKKPPGYIY